MKWRWMIWLLLLSLKGQATIRWTGLAGNGFWSDPGNWEGGVLPNELEDILLDNSLLPSGYTVVFPDFQVTVRSLTIMPDGPDSIKVIIPVSNLLSSPSGSLATRAFVTTGNGYTLLIGPRAVFINASGSSSGYSMRITDSIQIRNGGTYIHRTRTGHAELVQFLSRQAGTEYGLVRFENTDAASTISLSGRVYGSLQLSAAATAGGNIAYSSSGTNPVHIRGNLSIGQGVHFALNLEDTLYIDGDLLLTNVLCNLASANRSAVLRLAGNWLQEGGSVIASNTSQKTATMLLQGSGMQVIKNTGIVGDGVEIAVDNPAGIKLLSPLNCPSNLSLTNGVLYTTIDNLLVLGTNAILIADSLRRNTFIDGPMLKKGLNKEYAFFPVGGKGQLRWMGVRGIAGDCLVTYKAEAATAIGTEVGAGLDHISNLEYWGLRANVLDGSVELSFDHVNSGGVTELVSLRVAEYENSHWSDAGNSATTGTAFGAGSVRSELLGGAGNTDYYFTLASTSSYSNPLPITIENQWMTFYAGQWIANWEADHFEPTALFFLELSEDGTTYLRIAEIKAEQRKRQYSQSIPKEWTGGYCRIVLVHEGGSYSTGRAIRFGNKAALPEQLQVFHSHGSPYLGFNAGKKERIRMDVYDFSGRLIQARVAELPKGNSSFKIVDKSIPHGLYILKMTDERGNSSSCILFF